MMVSKAATAPRAPKQYPIISPADGPSPALRPESYQSIDAHLLTWTRSRVSPVLILFQLLSGKKRAATIAPAHHQKQQ